MQMLPRWKKGTWSVHRWYLSMLFVSLSCPGLWWLKAGYFCSDLYVLKLQYRSIYLCEVTKIPLNMGEKHKSLGFDSSVYHGTATRSPTVNGWDVALPSQDLVNWKERRPLLSCVHLVETLCREHPCTRANDPHFQISADRNPIMRQRPALGVLISYSLGIGIGKFKIISVMII